MYDLIYAGNDVRRQLQQQFPQAEIEDASDDVHGERFSIQLPDAERDTYRAFLQANRLQGVSFNLQLHYAMGTEPTRQEAGG